VREFHEWAGCLNATKNGNVPKVSFLAKIHRGQITHELLALERSRPSSVHEKRIWHGKKDDALEERGTNENPFYRESTWSGDFSRREREGCFQSTHRRIRRGSIFAAMHLSQIADLYSPCLLSRR